MPRNACTAHSRATCHITCANTPHPSPVVRAVLCRPRAGELRFQPLSTSITSLPPSLLAAGADVPFEAGAPNALWAPEVLGFVRLPGETIALSGAFACEGSLRPETGKRAMQGVMQLPKSSICTCLHGKTRQPCAMHGKEGSGACAQSGKCAAGGACCAG